MSSRPNRDEIVKLGFGTGHLREYDVCFETVIEALEIGYRHIDTARAYRNETAIGDAVRQSDISRESVFLATKVHSKQLGYENCIESVDAGRNALGVETIDLVYVHWPAHEYDASETLAALASLQSSGVIRHIGVSNFTVEVLREARNASTVPISAIQVEMHPYLQQDRLYEYANRYDIWLFAHTPLCQGDVIPNRVLSSITKKHSVTEAQVALAWLLEKDGVGVVTGARGEQLRENYAAQSVALDTEDVRRINTIDKHERCVDYEFSPWETD